jgi:hypothetical protein
VFDVVMTGHNDTGMLNEVLTQRQFMHDTLGVINKLSTILLLGVQYLRNAVLNLHIYAHVYTAIYVECR